MILKAATNVTPIETQVTIKAPDIRTAEFSLKSTAPMVQSRFSQKAKDMIRDKQAAGSTAKRKREAKDFDAIFHSAYYKMADGAYGIPASAFRSAMIRACSLVDFKMTQARMSIFIEADGYDAKDPSVPLVRIKGTPKKLEMALRNDRGGADIRVRAMFPEWSAKLRVNFDADQFTMNDVANLLARAGIQVGVMEGRPMSRESAGCGWGTFRTADER